MKIEKTWIENINNMRFIGIRYEDSDRNEANNSFDYLWKEWFETKRFEQLSNNRNPYFNKAYIGFTNTLDNNSYWIGMFFDKDEFIPAGFDFFDFVASEVVCSEISDTYESSELFGLEAINESIDAFIDKGYFKKYKISQDWFFELYDQNKYNNKNETSSIKYYFKLRVATAEDEQFLKEVSSK
ncbi:hypothetical protein [Mycoplasma sp. P36-A1]|uniref:hypothetical protein n=1 Tax=Mycoplasma sp. P36-A1 TaxID=3252900 RepID=UPI003C2B0333